MYVLICMMDPVSSIFIGGEVGVFFKCGKKCDRWWPRWFYGVHLNKYRCTPMLLFLSDYTSHFFSD